MSQTDLLDLGTLRVAFPHKQFLHLKKTTSTNDVVFEMASNGAENLIVFAEQQTAGRGQHGRRWESAAGKGLWFSLLLHPPIAPSAGAQATTAAAQAIAKVICVSFSLGATVKPPNDVFAEGRKVCGVLLEMRAVPGGHLGILGVGVNVNHREEDFPVELRGQAASLAMLTGKQIDRANLAVALIRALDQGWAPSRLPHH